MERWVRVVNASRGGAELLLARWCATFACRLRGLMWQAPPGEGRGLLLVEPRDSRAGTSIHMAFVRFSIAAAWLDGARSVVDCRVARPWRVYAPRRPARYVLEGPVNMLERLAVGDVLEFFDAPMG